MGAWIRKRVSNDSYYTLSFQGEFSSDYDKEAVCRTYIFMNRRLHHVQWMQLPPGERTIFAFNIAFFALPNDLIEVVSPCSNSHNFSLLDEINQELYRESSIGPDDPKHT